MNKHKKSRPGPRAVPAQTPATEGKTPRFEVNVHVEEKQLAIEMRCRLSPAEAMHLAKTIAAGAKEVVLRTPIIIPK